MQECTYSLLPESTVCTFLISTNAIKNHSVIHFPVHVSSASFCTLLKMFNACLVLSMSYQRKISSVMQKKYPYLCNDCLKINLNITSLLLYFAATTK